MLSKIMKKDSIWNNGIQCGVLNIKASIVCKLIYEFKTIPVKVEIEKSYHKYISLS